MDDREDAGQKYTFYAGAAYWEYLETVVAASGKNSRILAMTMTLDPFDSNISSLLGALHAAGKRGAHIALSTDAYEFIDSPRLGPLFWHKSFPRKLSAYYQARLSAVERINELPNGCAFITNKPGHRFSLPIAGRSHIKLAVVDDHVFIGSHNMDHTTWSNLTVGFVNKQAADWLYNLLAQSSTADNIASSLEFQDRTFQLPGNAKILVDAGVRGQSIIYDHALELIDSSREWLTITCQYMPNSVTARHLLAAKKRGVKVKIYYAHASYQGRTGSALQYFSQAIERTRLPRSMFQHGLKRTDPMLHAKLIACDAGMIIGSHNYVRAGVQLGTAELALLSSDSALAEHAVAAITVQLGQLKRRN